MQRLKMMMMMLWAVYRQSYYYLLKSRRARVIKINIAGNPVCLPMTQSRYGVTKNSISMSC